MTARPVPPTSPKLRLLSFQGPVRILHLTWLAFFLSFFVWFNHAPLMASIREALNLSEQEVKALLILNVALTIPARIVVGMLVDRYGPRLLFATLLALAGVLCIGFALADSFQQAALLRFLLGFVGAGFVIGIRMIAEWFPAKQVGLAEGIYGGWGNFGSAAAAMTLPTLALLFGGENGWRWAIGTTGALAIAYSFVYYFSVRNTPKGSTYFRPRRSGALEVTSKGDLILYLITCLPLYIALGLLIWKLGPGQLGLLPEALATALYGTLILLYAYQALNAWRVNRHVLSRPVPAMERYRFRQVAVLALAYLATFGSELAVVSMLPLHFIDTFGLSEVAAGLLASAFAFTNLFARPGGGLLSDRIGRRRSLLLLLGGLVIGYVLMAQIESSWPLVAALAVTMLCSFFVQAGEGAVFAVVPLIKRRLTGQIAGLTGAYGNVGAVLFLTVLSFVSPQAFFLTIAAVALLAAAAVYLFLEEPRGKMAEVLPDGRVQLIDVS